MKRMNLICLLKSETQEFADELKKGNKDKLLA